jgi:hypothetical protein
MIFANKAHFEKGGPEGNARKICDTRANRDIKVKLSCKKLSLPRAFLHQWAILDANFFELIVSNGRLLQVKTYTQMCTTSYINNDFTCTNSIKLLSSLHDTARKAEQPSLDSNKKSKLYPTSLFELSISRSINLVK